MILHRRRKRSREQRAALWLLAGLALFFSLFVAGVALADPDEEFHHANLRRRRSAQDFYPGSQAIASGGTNEVSFGTTTAFNGSAHASCLIQFRTQTSGCNSTATVLQFVQHNTASNRQFQFGCENNAWRVSVGNGTTMFNKSTSSNYFPLAALNVTAFWIYDGDQASDEDRLYTRIFSEYHGLDSPTLSDSGQAIPATLPSASSAPLLLSPASAPVNAQWIDNLICWPNYTLTTADICRLLGGAWSGSTCLQGTTPGVLQDPMDPAIVATAPSFCYVFEPGDDTTSVINRCAPGTNNGTVSDGSLAYVAASPSQRLPIDSLVNSSNNQQDHPQDDWDDVDYAFRWARGWAARESINPGNGSRTYNMQPKLWRVDQLRERLMFHSGDQHADDSHRFFESLTYNRGKSFGMSGVVDWPFSPGNEAGRELTVTDVNSGPNGNGDRGGAVFINPVRTGAGNYSQGTAMMLWNSVPITDQGATLERYLRAVYANDWYATQPTWTLIGSSTDYSTGGFFSGQGCTGTALWDSQGAHPCIVTFAGNTVCATYNRDTGDTEYCTKVHRCPAGSDCTTTAAWTQHYMAEDGDATNPTYIPEELTLTLIKGGPNHGRVVGCIRSDPAPPGGFQAHECACTWTDDIDNPAGPTWAVLGADPPGLDGPYGLVDWTTGNAVSCYNTFTPTQLDNGRLVACVRSPPDGSTNRGDMVCFTSVDWGATWSELTRLTTGMVADERLAQIAHAVQYEPNRIQVIHSYEVVENPNYTSGLVVEIDPALTASGPLTWANDGALRLNDLGATNESVIFGDLRVLKGQTAVTFEFRAAKLSAATSTEYLIEQWGATDAASMFELHLASNGVIAGTIENGASDCVFASASSTWTQGRWHHVGLTYTGGGSPSFALTLDGVSVASACSSGSLPAAWPSSTGSELRAGVHYDGTGALVDGFIDELAIWHYSASVAQLLAASGTATDPRARDWNLSVDGFTQKAVPMHYYALDGSAGSDCKDSPTNNRIIDYGYAYAQLWGDGQNLEAGDYGASLTLAFTDFQSFESADPAVTPQYAVAADNAIWETSSDVTVGVFFEYNASDVTTGDWGFVTKATGFPVEYAFLGIPQAANDTWQAQMSWGGTPNHCRGPALLPNTWYGLIGSVNTVGAGTIEDEIDLWITTPGNAFSGQTNCTTTSGTLPETLTLGTGEFALGAYRNNSCATISHCPIGPSHITFAFMARYGKIDLTQAQCMFPSGRPNMAINPSTGRAAACDCIPDMVAVYFLGEGGDTTSVLVNQCAVSTPAMNTIGSPTFSSDVP